MTRVTLAAVMLLTLARAANAGVCVVLDPQRDTLAPGDRRAAEISFEQALAKAGVQVTNTDCTTTYTFYNVKLGNTITVYAIGPTGTREGRASNLGELPLVYEQIAHSLVTGEPMSTGGGNVDRTNATNDQMAPRRVQSDNVKIFRLGYGGVTGTTTSTGPAFGFGWRFELDQIGIEIAGELLEATDSSSRNAGFTGSVRLGAMYYQDPIANASFYYGGGLGFGGSAVDDNGMDYSGSGLEGHITVGYETLRASTIRLFVEGTATLPFYTSSGINTAGAASRRWIPSIALEVGIGWGHANTVAVVNR